jgi:protein-disulfide isomerase
MSKRRELEAQRQEQERKQWITIAAIIAGIAVVVIGGAVILSNVTGIGTGTNSNQTAPVLPPIKTTSAKPPPNAQPNELAWGPANSPIKIVEYLDYQCPHCQSFYKSFEPALTEAFAGTGKVRYELRPLPFLDRGTTESTDTAQGAYCAAEQGKAWEYHSLIFENHPSGYENIGNYSKGRIKEMFGTLAGVDAAKFAACLDSDQNKAKVNANAEEAATNKVQSTPSFVVNGKLITGDGRISSVDGWKQIFAEVAPDVKLP